MLCVETAVQHRDPLSDGVLLVPAVSCYSHEKHYACMHEGTHYLFIYVFTKNI